jgi:trehalose-6-phosphate synthase
MERAARMRTMRAAVRHNDVHRWARTFLNRLQSTTSIRAETTKRDVVPALVETIPS